MPAAPAATEFRAAHRDHLDPGFAQQRVRMGVAVVGHHHARLERDLMLVGQGAYFELWDSGLWNAKLTQALAGPAAPPPGMEDFSL